MLGRDMGSWIPPPGEARTYLVYIVNIMATDDLEKQGTWASATLI